MPDIYNLEIHVAHACNLACESCSHYSNHGHKGLVSQLTQFARISRQHWPLSTLRIVANGFFLHRHPELA